MTSSEPDRAAVVIVEDERVALVERIRGGRTYHLFPGGGIEDGETPAQAAVREAREELGVDVELGEVLLELEFGGVRQSYFAARLVGGVFGTGTFEHAGPEPEFRGSYTPVWVPLDALDGLDVRPRELIPLIR